MTETRECNHCGKTYSRNVNYTDTQWSRSKFCSRRCAARKAVNATTLERLFSFIKIDQSTKCWLWMGTSDAAGYGFFNNERVHRFVFRTAVEEIPSGMSVLHRCDTKNCCNPFHLFLGTHQDNYDDMRMKGREKKAFGSSVGTARLTEEDVRAIRADERSQDDIAREYQIAQTTVSAIKRGKNWKHV